ncbi:MAG: hypothetical protein Fur0018_24410 [Anaerolineales bacterium]
MQLITNEKLIQRNARIGGILSLAGLIAMGLGVYLNFKRPDLANYSFAALISGFMLAQIGLYFGNRWGRARPTEKLLNDALKGLSQQHKLYHYSSPASHLLVGPTGVWVLIPKYQRGTITYKNNRWRQSGGGLWLAYLKLLAQEGIGRPDLEIAAEVDAVSRFLKKHLPENLIPPVNAVLVFTNPRAEVQADDAPVPTVTLKKLKAALRSGKQIPPEKYTAVQQALES